MNLSMRWLREFVDIDKNIDMRSFCEAITMSGSKVEMFEKEGGSIDNIVVGKILSIEKHPDADKLRVCMVDVGESESLQIVTGVCSGLRAGRRQSCRQSRHRHECLQTRHCRSAVNG